MKKDIIKTIIKAILELNNQGRIISEDVYKDLKQKLGESEK